MKNLKVAMKKCKVCGDPTDVSFNIGFKKTPICENCAISIFLQQAKWYTEQFDNQPKNETKKQ